ncbi:hypothetical protein K492DRAFT_208631 [Lichtheimia hyalospora FSU 10163]|nr:hypothetical protein K492DRAFT_208631 [Lichtheimia hyalospora FSU 10163]
MSNNSQHVFNTSNVNDTERSDHQRHRMPPIVVNNVIGSRSSSSSPHASSADSLSAIKNQHHSSIIATTSLSPVGQYLPIKTSLPEGMRQVLPLHSPLWTNLIPLLTLQGSLASNPSRTTSRPIPQTTEQLSSAASAATSQSPTHTTQSVPSTTPNPQQRAMDISHQSSAHNEMPVTQAKENNSSNNIVTGPKPAANDTSTTNTPNDHNDDRAANPSIPVTQTPNASTENSSPEKKNTTKKVRQVRQADNEHLTMAKKLARYGPSLKTYKPLQDVRQKYGLPTIENAENQHGTAQMDIDNEDMDMDIEIADTVDKEDDVITSSAADNAVDNDQDDDIEEPIGTSVRENDYHEHPASTTEQEQPANIIEQEQQLADITEREQQASNIEQHNNTPSTAVPGQDMDVDSMDIEDWTNYWKEYDPEFCCICIKNNFNANNKLVYCSNPLCEVVVHQACYGIHEIPSQDEPWYCDRCEDSPNDLRVVCCALCPSTRGAFRRLDKPYDGVDWIHVACALRSADVKISNTKDKSGITLPSYHNNIWEGHCVYCSDSLSSHYGGYCECKHSSCNARAHISCATRLYNYSSQRIPSFRCPEHRSVAVSAALDLNPWEIWVNKRDDWLQREESFGFVYHAWTSVMEPVYRHDHPSQDMIDESTKLFVNMISQHLVDFMNKELRNVDRARSSTDRLKRKLCSTHVEASKLCDRVDKVQDRVKQVSFLRAKIRQYSIDIRGYMEMILLQLDTTRLKQNALQNAPAIRASLSTTLSRGRKRSLSEESFTTANDQSIDSPISTSSTDIDKEFTAVDKGKGKSTDNIQKPAGVTSSKAQLANLQRPLKKRSKIYAAEQSTQKPVITVHDKQKQAETNDMDNTTSPPPPATIEKPSNTETTLAENETSSPPSSTNITETAKATTEELYSTKANTSAIESSEHSVQQKQSVIEENIDKSMQETQSSTTTTITTEQRSPSPIEQRTVTATDTSVPIVIDEPASNVDKSTTPIVERQQPPADESAKTTSEQPTDASARDNTQAKPSHRRGKRAKRTRKSRDATGPTEKIYKPGTSWWIWVEEYTKELRQRVEKEGPLVCKECGQHNIPESTLAGLKYNPDELVNPKNKPYGYTGTGDDWNPTVLIECMGCKDIYHCGCSAIPVRKYPSKNESFYCEDCLESFEANKTYKRVGYGLDERAPQGPRKRERINYKE